MTDRSLAIVQQLGGSRFIAMTGACAFLATERGIRFRIHVPGWNGRGVVNVALDPDDTYTMQFLSVRGTDVTTKAELTGLHGDQLSEVFTRVTGLYTSLGDMGGAR